ncbi:hypothetical protein D082_09360 [Synechocystis sp. PCC 6714]|nr:hypothetical protein D082_09360 [Synechocystis sp. PCC 6714]
MNHNYLQPNPPQKVNDEQAVYDYLLDLVQAAEGERVLEIIGEIFLAGQGSSGGQVSVHLEKVIKVKYNQEDFNYFFNRCCYILINYWQLSPQTQRTIPQLVKMLENGVANISANGNARGNIRQLIKNFTLSEQFVRLKRLGTVIAAKFETKSTSVGTLIHRYPYLYDYCLMGDDSSREHRQTVHRIKAQNERKFEINLSQYVTYRVRLARVNKSSLILPDQELITPVKNPTLLSDRDLNSSLKHFVGSVENGQSYQSLSKSFRNHVAYTQSFGAFKDELYEYIRGSLQDKYRHGSFNKKLFDLFQNAYPECNQQKPTEFLMMRTSSQLLNFLVVEGSKNPDHYVFIDLISNIGVKRTVGVLLKIVLFCSKVKPYLEKRFSILFNHYESVAREGVPWLVRTLENMQIAFSIHFGRVDLSSLHRSKLVT